MILFTGSDQILRPQKRDNKNRYCNQITADKKAGRKYFGPSYIRSDRSVKFDLKIYLHCVPVRKHDNKLNSASKVLRHHVTDEFTCLKLIQTILYKRDILLCIAKHFNEVNILGYPLT